MRTVSRVLADSQLTQAEIAEDVGCDRSRLSRYATGSDPIPLARAVELCNATDDVRLLQRAVARLTVGGLSWRLEADDEGAAESVDPAIDQMRLFSSLGACSAELERALFDGHFDRSEAAAVADRLEVHLEQTRAALARVQRLAGIGPAEAAARKVARG